MYIYVYCFIDFICLIGGKIETKNHLEQSVYLLTKTSKYDDSALGTEVAG